MTEHRIDIALADSSRVKYRVHYLGVRIGTWSDPETNAARYLIEQGLASVDDTLLACRDGKASLTGRVGWLAKYVVYEDDVSSPHFRKHQPMSEETKAALRAGSRRSLPPRTAETGSGGCGVAEADDDRPEPPMRPGAVSRSASLKAWRTRKLMKAKRMPP